MNDYSNVDISRSSFRGIPPNSIFLVVSGGIMNERCQPDNSGRQAALKPNLYPTDVLNILVETGGFRIITSSTSQQQNIGGVSCSHVVWTLEK